MSESKVKFTVTVHDVDLATWAKVEGVSEADAAEEFAIIASGYVGDALRARFDNESLNIWTTRDDGTLLLHGAPRRLPRLMTR